MTTEGPRGASLSFEHICGQLTVERVTGQKQRYQFYFLNLPKFGIQTDQKVNVMNPVDDDTIILNTSETRVGRGQPGEA